MCLAYLPYITITGPGYEKKLIWSAGQADRSMADEAAAVMSGADISQLSVTKQFLALQSKGK
jgi:hypothetical protein